MPESAVTNSVDIPKKYWREFNIAIFILEIALTVSAVVFCHIYGVLNLKSQDIITVSIDMFILILSPFIYACCMRVASLKKANVAFMLLLFSNSGYVYFDVVTRLLNGRTKSIRMLYALNTAYYLFPIIMAGIFLNFVYSLVEKPDKLFKGVFALSDSLGIIGAVLILVNIKFNYYFYIDSFGNYIRKADTYYLSLIIPTLMLFVCAYFIVSQKLESNKKITLIMYPALPYVVTAISLFYPAASIIPLCSSTSLLIIFANLFVWQEKELETKKKELAEAELNTMLLQISPHFIYNTLGSIGGLCVENPEKAREMIFAFSNYLRNNRGALTNESLVPFSKEIEHLKYYVDIEKQRFPDIEVIFDLHKTDFNIPGLSVQPLVENAITHGIMGREAGGTVKIGSYDDDDFYYITVEDNGVGFENQPKNDGRAHIGIANVKKRLDMICSGVLVIESTVGKGTKAKIIIPKKRGDN